MRTFYNIKRIQFYFALGLAWLSLWLFNSFISYTETFALHALNEIWRSVYIVLINYIFFEYCQPLIIKKRSKLLFSILVGILFSSLYLISISFGLYCWSALGMNLDIYSQLWQSNLLQSNLLPYGPYDELLFAVFYEAECGVASVIFFGIAKLIHYNIQLRQDAQQLRLEKKEAELNYLKSQMNPHFLFNTLNNIYSLARDRSELAPESILRLSKILRFMLYDTNVEYISVAQELEISSDYIALEKLRYDDSLLINFKHEVEDMQQPLPPLLLMPLIENAFKHGASETSDNTLVDIYLSIDQRQLLFEVKNPAEVHQSEKRVKENIGLSNLRRQLQLLYTDYNLSVRQEGGVFAATLKINLATHV